ncbi:Fur family transcriptional regulator [Maribacter sp. 2307ULW6-5]|uniref:Fur family transcriptional regulator n=1 Tax=Maribacter sp. 2307ULW6-5 TaxID=3386275 RepID=UPI0039BD3AB1
MEDHGAPFFLKRKDIAATPTRVMVLRLFLSQRTGLSLANVCDQLYFSDSSTVFRTLRLFVHKGVLHTVVTPDGERKYTLCQKDCTEKGHLDRHPHFSCQHCRKLFCLPGHPMPVPYLKDGSQVEDVYLSFGGVCNECK